LTRLYVRLFIFAFASIVCLGAGGASRGPRVLTGKMAWWQQIVGLWTCSVTIEPGDGQYPQKGFTIDEGSVVPGNVFV
jgi:hypothetical protein